MVTAWVLARHVDGSLSFEERYSSAFTNTRPEDWGLPTNAEVLLVLQQGQFLQAWLRGSPNRRW